MAAGDMSTLIERRAARRMHKSGRLAFPARLFAFQASGEAPGWGKAPKDSTLLAKLCDGRTASAGVEAVESEMRRHEDDQLGQHQRGSRMRTKIGMAGEEGGAVAALNLRRSCSCWMGE